MALVSRIVERLHMALRFTSLVLIGALAALALGAAPQATSSSAPANAAPAVPIDIAHSPAPLFDDPVFHGASDPFVIWNPVRKQWFMYYTQRRATLANPKGVDWVHGSAIGIATSDDGAHWKYLGVCQGDHDLSEPLKATNGKGPEPGITWWAPCFLQEKGTLHMWVVLVDGIYTSWTGNRNIVHFTSDDGVNWKYADTCKLSSNRVIDPTVYKVKDLWYMVYKDEADGSHTHVSSSTDLKSWTTLPTLADRDGSQEAPFVFHWKDSYWLIVDGLGDKGLRVYKSETGIDNFVYNNTVLAAKDGTRPRDNNVGHHPGMVLQGGPNNEDHAMLFLFHASGEYDGDAVDGTGVGGGWEGICGSEQICREFHGNAEQIKQDRYVFFFNSS